MAKWLAPIIAVSVLVVGVAVGAAVWAQNSDAETCDGAALDMALADGMHAADASGKAQFDIDRPAHCGEDDIAAALAEMTRGWHMMPGGTMMREASAASRALKVR